MAEVTDAPFRQIVVQCGKPDVLYNEFISTEGLCSAGRERLLKDLVFKDNEHPIVAQFFGTKPQQFYECAKLAWELGFDGVDINMGCPDRKVVKQGAGIALCKTPELAKEIIAAAREGANSIPVSVKTRLGLYADESSVWIPHLLEAKIPALTIHGRTMKEMSAVPAHWDAIGRVSEMAKGTGTLIIGNGDVMSREEGEQKAEQYRLDGIMVGRGIFHNPWFFNRDKKQETITPKQRLDVLLDHTRRFAEFWGQDKNFHVLKRFFKIYVSGWSGASRVRSELMDSRTRDDVERIIDAYKKRHPES